MARGWVHTVYRGGAWCNEIEDGAKLSTHATKDDATVAGKQEAMRRRTEHLVHEEDGTVGSTTSYGD